MWLGGGVIQDGSPCLKFPLPAQVMTEVVEPSGVDQPLPPGWEAVQKKDQRVYYWNKKTGATTWKFPEREGMCGLVCQCA